MKWYKNLKISAKLIIGFLIVAVLAGFIGVTGVISLNAVGDNAEYLYSYATEPIRQVSSALNLYQENRVETRNLLLTESNAEVYQIIDGIRQKSDEITAILTEYEKTIATSTGRGYYEDFVAAYDAYLPILNEIIELVQDGRKEEAYAVLFGDDMKNAATAVQDGLQGLINTRAKNGAREYESIVNTSLSSKTIMVVQAFVGAASAVFLGIAISRSISRPINQMVEIADKLALGDIDVEIENSYNDETGELAKAFRTLAEAIRGQAHLAKRMAEGDFSIDVELRSDRDVLGKALIEMISKINDLMTQIAFSSEQVANGAKQISDSSIMLSEGATEQATAIEQLTTSLEEISSQTENNAKNADKANELTKEVKTYAGQGNEQMREMLKAMEEINVSSNSIYKIIKVVDDIAFQTNILALNAAVEAARAGQYGKGFAVVAEEVRTLAAKSADAAKETTELIENSIGKVDEGTRIAGKTAEFLNTIVNEIDKVYSLINDIASASGEQTNGIGQVNQGIIQVSNVVQTNSSTAEETAAASEELANQAELLQEMISKFKLKKDNTVRNDGGRSESAVFDV